MNVRPLPATYVVPVRWTSPGPIAALASYLGAVGEWVDEAIVVDDSPEPIFRQNARELPATVLHMAPDPSRCSANGKVDGILTGVETARNELIVIADDDVRWQPEEIERALRLLDDAELVRPQNFFEPLSWHARWDTARSLLNRVLTGDRQFPVGDFPGTFALRRSFLREIGGYDGETLFENLEMMRKIAAAGGRIVSPLDLYVPRVPPTFGHFRGQRVRQAYDDWAMPARMACFLGIAPAVLAAVVARRWRALTVAALAPVAVAEAGRRRAGGAARFPLSGSLLAPVWVAERSVCAWIALWRGLSGKGVLYGRGRLVRAATPPARLRSAVPPARRDPVEAGVAA